MTPSGFAFGETARSASTRGVLNDALSIYFGDATLASAFVARWCAGYEVETGGGVFPSAGGIADATSRSDVAPDTMSEGRVMVDQRKAANVERSPLTASVALEISL